MNNSQVILEESDPSKNKELKLTNLWPDSPHTNRLKQTVEEFHGKIIPVDIRVSLIPFSWELITKKENDGNRSIYRKISAKIYLSMLYDFVNNRGKTYEEYIKPNLDKLSSVEDKVQLNNLFRKEIKEKFDIIYESIGGNKKTMGELFDNASKFENLEDSPEGKLLLSINEVNSRIMEFYVILLILIDKRNSWIHVGLAHSEIIKKWLPGYFKYTDKGEAGMTSMNTYYEMGESEQPKACVLNPNIGDTIVNQKMIKNIIKNKYFSSYY